MTPKDNHSVQVRAELDAVFIEAGLNETDARAWTIVYGDLDPEVVLTWLDTYAGRPHEIEAASKAWAEFRLMQTRGAVLLH